MKVSLTFIFTGEILKKYESVKRVLYFSIFKNLLVSYEQTFISKIFKKIISFEN